MIPKEAKYAIGATLALAGLRVASAALLYAAARRLTWGAEKEAEFLRDLFEKAKSGEYEACFDGQHVGIRGDANPFVGENVIHYGCQIKHCDFTVHGVILPRAFGVAFEDNAIRVAGEAPEENGA